jgi:hypothetical protein
MPRDCFPSAKQVSIGHRIPLKRTNVLSEVVRVRYTHRSSILQWSGCAAAPTRPLALASLAYRHHPTRGKVRHQGAFTACFDHLPRPLGGRHLRRNGCHHFSLDLPRAQTAPTGLAATPRPRGHRRLRTLAPHARVMRHFGTVPQTAWGHLVEKIRVTAKAFVTRHPDSATPGRRPPPESWASPAVAWCER